MKKPKPRKRVSSAVAATKTHKDKKKSTLDRQIEEWKLGGYPGSVWMEGK